MSTEEKEGWVYCISNENVRSASSPNNILLKIGMTDRTPQERLAEANKSDTWRPPVNYKIEFAKRVKNALKKEKTLHKLLEQYNERVNRSREFFDISVEKARLYFDLMDGEYWEPPPQTTQKEKIKKGGQRKKNEIDDSNPINIIESNTPKANKVEINKEINDILASNLVKKFEFIFNSNVKDLGSDESKKLLMSAFDKGSLDIKLKSTYYTFEKLNQIQGKNIGNKIFRAILSSPSQPDMFITTQNIDSAINQIKYKTDSTFIILEQVCKL
jgi:hypothetical protein